MDALVLAAGPWLALALGMAPGLSLPLLLAGALLGAAVWRRRRHRAQPAALAFGGLLAAGLHGAGMLFPTLLPICVSAAGAERALTAGGSLALGLVAAGLLHAVVMLAAPLLLGVAAAGLRNRSRGMPARGKSG